MSERNRVAMAIINEVTCARCDRKYSGVRSRCPYCGARRIGRGKYSEDSDNAKGKMLICVLIIGVFAVASGILLFSTPNEANAGSSDNPAIHDPIDDEPDEPSLVVDTPPPQETPEPTPVVQQEVLSVQIQYEGRPLRWENEFSLQKGRTLDITAKVEPVTLEADVTWEGTNEEVFEFTNVPGVANAVRVHGIEVGTARIIARAGDKEHVVTVRITN